MNKSLLIGGAIAAFAAVSCSTVRNMPVNDLSGEWNVVEIEGKAISVPDGCDRPYMAFDAVNNRLFGSVGCNRIMGVLSATDAGSIDLSGMGSTRMMCPDMTIEDRLLSAFNQVKEFGIDKKGQLVLMDGQQHRMVTLAKRINEIDPESLVGSFKVNLLGDLDLSDNAEGDYTIEFMADGTFSMTTGCNNIGGKYTGKYVDITFGRLMSTRMMCPNMEVEQTAQKLLPTVVSFGRLAEEGTYGFYDAQNNLLMTISRL